jgi:hypothetical protein
MAQAPCQLHQQQAAVGQSGQGVMEGELAHLVFQPPAIGDVHAAQRGIELLRHGRIELPGAQGILRGDQGMPMHGRSGACQHYKRDGQEGHAIKGPGRTF